VSTALVIADYASDRVIHDSQVFDGNTPVSARRPVPNPAASEHDFVTSRQYVNCRARRARA
jgi:hypothetical protein